MKTGIKNVFAKGASVILASLMLIGMIQTGTLRADPSAGLSKSGSAEVGKTISVNVSVSGDGPYGGYNGKVSYDGEFFDLEGISSGNYGAANFSKNGASFLDYNCNIPSGSTVVVVKLKCKKEGTTKVSVNLNVSSLDGAFDYSTGSSAEITISAPVQLSGNNYLKSLSVAPGSLSPSFSKGTTNYHVTVSESQTSIAVSASAEHGKAKVSLNGVQKDLQMGDNTVKVTVTAENGEKRTYKIIVTRGTPTPTPEPYPVIVTNGESYTILEKESLETVPSGFTWSETTYNSKTVPCLVGPDGTLMMWLLSDSGNGLYIYDLNSQTVAPCYSYTAEAVSMLIIPFPADFQTPAGYEKTTYKYNDQDIEVYKNTQSEDMPMLVYMLDSEGKSGMYFFDAASGTVLPFRGDLNALIATPTPLPTETPTPTPSPTPSSTPTPTPTPEPKSSSVNGFKTATILLGIVSTGLLALVIFMFIMRRKEQESMLEVNEPDEETPDEPKKDSEQENEGDHYYQFGDEEPQPRRPGAKRAGESDTVSEEPKKEEPLPDFPEFPEKKPEPVIEEPSIPTPLITVVDSETDKLTGEDESENTSDDTEDKDTSSAEEQESDSSSEADEKSLESDSSEEAEDSDTNEESGDDTSDSDASDDEEDDGEI